MMIVVVMIVVVMILLIVFVLTRIVTFMVKDILVLCDALKMLLELALTLTFGQRAELHIDVTTGHARILVKVPHGDKVLFDLLGKQMSEFLMRHLTAAELELDAHLVTFGEEVFGVRDLDQVIMRIDTDAELHLLHLAALLMLVGLLFVLLLDVLVLAVVDDFAHRRIDVWRDFHEIKTTLLGDANGLRRGKDAELMMPIFLNDTHLRRTDALIDSGLIHKAAIGPVATTRAISTTAAGTKRSTTTSASIATCWTRRTCGTWKSSWRACGTWCCTRWSGRAGRTWWRRAACTLILLGTRGEIAAAQLLEWIAYRIPPGVFKTPSRRVATTWKIIREKRAANIMISTDSIPTCTRPLPPDQAGWLDATKKKSCRESLLGKGTLIKTKTA